MLIRRLKSILLRIFVDSKLLQQKVRILQERCLRRSILGVEYLAKFHHLEQGLKFFQSRFEAFLL